MNAYGAGYCPVCGDGNPTESTDGRNLCRSCMAVWGER